MQLEQLKRGLDVVGIHRRGQWSPDAGLALDSDRLALAPLAPQVVDQPVEACRTETEYRDNRRNQQTWNAAPTVTGRWAFAVAVLTAVARFR